jgi:hypothetical protein
MKKQLFKMYFSIGYYLLCIFIETGKKKLKNNNKNARWNHMGPNQRYYLLTALSTKQPDRWISIFFLKLLINGFCAILN